MNDRVFNKLQLLMSMHVSASQGLHHRGRGLDTKVGRMLS